MTTALRPEIMLTGFKYIGDQIAGLEKKDGRDGQISSQFERELQLPFRKLKTRMQ